jgi:dTDP-4-amino-4,6-dideoxygalactose transaminase
MGALYFVMCALDLKRGDKVICSINCFPDVPEVVRHFDAEPIFVDCDPKSYQIDLDKLEKILEANKSKKLRAVIVSHIAGETTDLERLYGMARDNNVKVIEDASDAMGASYGDAMIGSSGADITTFSFTPHIYDHLNYGGMFVCNDDELYKRAKLFRTHAIKNEDIGSYDQVDYLYDVVEIGWMYNMSELSAAHSLAQLEMNSKRIKRHREIAQTYLEKLVGIPHIRLPQMGEDAIFNNFIVEIDTNRDHFARELKKRGINVGLHYIPLNIMDYYKKKYELKLLDFPSALGVYQRVMSLPIYYDLTDSDVTYICDAIKEVGKKHI